MIFTKKQVDRILARAKKAWGLSEWTIDWQWGKCDYEGDIEIRFSEKYALITLDRINNPDRQTLTRTLYHEVAHCVLIVIERGISDFTDHYIKDRRARDVFWEQVNTRENEVIDHLITRVFHL